MEHTDLPGALRGTPPLPVSPAAFDEEHGAVGRSELIWRLAAEGYGEDYRRRCSRGDLRLGGPWDAACRRCALAQDR